MKGQHDKFVLRVSLCVFGKLSSADHGRQIENLKSCYFNIENKISIGGSKSIGHHIRNSEL